MQGKLINFHAYKARKQAQGTYLGVLPLKASEAFRTQMWRLLERHDALEQSIQVWEKDYQAYQQDLEASLDAYGLLPKGANMDAKITIIDERGHVFWEDG